MNKYRSRKKNGNIVGPFSVKEFSALLRSGEIDGDEEIQLYPVGDWSSLSSFKGLLEEFNKISSSVKQDLTFLANLNDTDLGGIEDHSKFREFSYSSNTPPVDAEVKEAEETSDSDKTAISLDTEKYLKELKRQKLEAENKVKQLKAFEESSGADINYEDEATQMINLDELKEEIKKSRKTEEKYLKEKIMLDSEKKSQEKNQHKEIAETYEKQEEDRDDEIEKAKKKKLIIIAASLLMFYFLFGGDDEGSKKEILTYKGPHISFPQQFDTVDQKIAKKKYDEAKILLKNQDYLSRVKAGIKLRESVENQFENNVAMAKLIFVYSSNLANSESYIEDSHAVFKLVQIFANKISKNIGFASAIAKFYVETEKYNAALKTIDKYKTLHPKTASVELFTVYLEAAIKIGKLDIADKIVKQLEKAKSFNVYTSLTLAEYYHKVGVSEKAKKVLKSALRFEKSAEVLLELGELYAIENDFKKLKTVLIRSKELKIEYSKILKAKYLKLKGIYYVSKKQFTGASKLFAASLKLVDSADLTSQLAMLEQSEDLEANKIIVQSKAKQLVKESKAAVLDENIRRAFSLAIEASELAPNYLPVQLWLAKLQVERGYLKDAITQLTTLFKKNKSNKDVIFGLIEAYTRAFKYKEASELLNSLRNMENLEDARYYLATSRYFLYKNEFFKSAGWLQRAINANPLNDENIYNMAKLYIKYKKFTKGKFFLNKAMELDPANVKYRTSYAEILYEMESSTSAIGYLYTVLKDFPDNPKLLSAIGIYLYRSGQIKDYTRIKEKLLKLPTKDISLYEFLIQSAKLDDDKEKVLEYTHRLLELNPGNLRSRLNLANVYIKDKRYEKALTQLKEIKSRVDTYPRLHYFFSTIYLHLGDSKKALELALKEVKENPTIVDGFVLLGDIYRELKEYPLAQKKYFKANQLDPQNVDAIVGLAYISFRNNQYDMALDQYQRAKEIDPGRADVYKLLGDVQRKLGQSQLAIRNYRYFLELSPNSSYKAKIQTYIRTMQ